MDFFYNEAETEIDAGTYDESLWDIAALEAGNDESGKKAAYVELRAKQSLQKSEDLLSCSGAQPSLQDDISGTYVSNITCDLCDYFRKYKEKTMVITLQQSGNSFTGVSNSFRDSSITGERDDDRYKFVYLSSPNSYEIRGEWKLGARGCGFSGNWSHSVSTASGAWNLTRIR